MAVSNLEITAVATIVGDSLGISTTSVITALCLVFKEDLWIRRLNL